MRFGAAVIIRAFDDQGQAASYKDKLRICQRSYRLLRSGLGFPPEDIIFDYSVMTIATGLPEHDNYGIGFINSCRNQAHMPVRVLHRRLGQFVLSIP